MNILLMEEKLETLSPELQQEVVNFVDFLISKNDALDKKNDEFSFKWAGGLSDYKKKYSSVDLQHKSMDWR